MPGAGKKVVKHSESGKSCFPKKDSGSELIASLKFKKGSKISKSKKLRSKSRCQSKTVNSTLLKRTVAESHSKGAGDDFARSKSISQKNLHIKIDRKGSKNWASSKHKGKNSALVISKGNGEVVDGDGETKKLRKGRSKKRRKEKVELDEASRLQRRTRYLLIKMKLEQNLIDAYSGEGWKGHSREKIRPEKELQRAKKQILKCKIGIRDAIRQLDSLSSVGCIEGSVIATDGSVHHEHIICAKCKLREAFPDNDIVLCDGTCNCAFHQKCLDPPLDTESIPPGDQGWFCKFCECKMEIIESMNAHIGTSFSVNSNWQDIFKEEAAFPDGCSALLNQEEEWPSDDSEDDDYNPERRENSCSISRAGTDDDPSSSTSLSWFSDSETFSESMSEDEDWGPAKRRRKEKESDAVNSLMTLYGSEEKYSKVKTAEVKKKLPSNAKIRRSFHRMPPNAVEKLRQVFAENELPSRIVKENLSKELSLEPEKVNKWFKNARYLALKARKVESARQVSGSPRISKESSLETEKKNADVLTLKNSLEETLICSPKSLKKIHPKRIQNQSAVAAASRKISRKELL
ncbi:hypothetical protein CISIN_1g0067541mg [Citrus sinensis]|uniref:Pathogenesis-related homeodomain protein n=1 Tax=Citrus sinensis TaxID=2711 RepID=A0A067F3G1_CITSI|nr:hypothetical protein CISIN_1g0067541mg [Citrus sinensis]